MSAIVSTTSRVTCPGCGERVSLTVHTTFDGDLVGGRRFELACRKGCVVPTDQLEALVANDQVA